MNTVKLLFDYPLTAAPAGCSTHVQFWHLAKYLLEDLKREDIRIYWRVPRWVTDEEFQSEYPQHPAVSYVWCDQHPNDRVQEYFRYSADMERDTNFYGELWDTDIVITVRSCIVPLMKMHMTSPRHRDMPWAKRVWLIEEMPMFDFKGTVPVTDLKAQELQTLAGYASADKVWLMSYHEKYGIMEAARKYVSPSIYRELQDKIKQVVPLQFDHFQLKEQEFFVPYEQKPFGVAFVGRMEKAQAQLEEVNDLFLSEFVRKGENVRLMACTTSRVFKCFDEELIEVERLPREKFWSTMKNDVHVVVTLSQEMGFSLSLLEPIILGTPAIVLKRPYVVPLLGEDYPFYVSGKAEAQGMVHWMYQNYPTAYAKFAEWHKTKFRPMYEQIFKTDLMYPLIAQAIDEYQQDVSTKYKTLKSAKVGNEILQLIAGRMTEESAAKLVDGELNPSVSLLEAVRFLYEKGDLESLGKKLKPEFINSTSLPWAPTWNEFRLTMKHLMGWEDAVPNQPGLMWAPIEGDDA